MEAPPVRAIRRRRMLHAVKVIVALTLLGLLVSRVDLAAVIAALSDVPGRTIASVMALLVLQFPLSAWKWRWSAAVCGHRFRTRDLLRYLSIGFFINNFLPSAIGGDAYRVLRTREGPGLAVAAAAVLLDRVVGLLALLALGFLGALLLMSQSPLARIYVLACLAGLLLVTVLAIIAWKMALLQSLARGAGKSGRLASLLETLRNVARPSAGWVPLVTLSLAFQASAALVLWLLFQGLGSPITLPTAALVAAAAGLAAVVPLSINGIGIVEGSIVGVAVATGADYDASLLAALALRILVLPLSALCGVLWMLERRPRPAAP